MTSDQKGGKSEKEGHDSLDNFIRQAIGKDSFQSFSTASDYRRQWIQSFQTSDQQGTNKLHQGPKVDRIDGKEWPLEYYNGVTSFASEINGVKESVHSLRGSGISVKGTKSSSENMQSLKIPEAVVAFAQAAAKANGEPEKYIHGWPLLSPTKVQMQKCDKCPREFCSPINYRRHIRVHRRSLNIDKDSPKNRDLLGAFWDKLSLDEAREIVSFKNVALEDVAGTSIVRELTSVILKPAFSSLPHVYVKAGVALLDIIQARPPRFPISSQEFFNILDDASEKTFLCAGTAVALQKFVFDGEAGKIGLEMKNLVACTSFLVEQKLIKAWITAKDAEALRCQKLLVEEEEAAQKRQAELLERKRLKKQRQKEQKAKEQIDGNKADFKQHLLDAGEGMQPAELSSTYLPSASDSSFAETSSNLVKPLLEPVQSLDTAMDLNIVRHPGTGDAVLDTSCGNTDPGKSQNVDLRDQLQQKDSQRKLTAARRLVPKHQRKTQKGFHSDQIPVLKSAAVLKHGNYRDQRTAFLANSHKVWTRKTKIEGEEEGSNVRVLVELGDQTDQSKCSEVLIGSINVKLGDCSCPPQDEVSTSIHDLCAVDHQKPRWNFQEKPAEPDTAQNFDERSTVKQWRPVGRHEIGGPMMVQSNKGEARVDGVSGSPDDCVLPHENGQVCSLNGDDSFSRCSDSASTGVDGATTGPQIFSNHAALAFLAQRWKEALAADHVKLFISSQTEPPGYHEIEAAALLRTDGNGAFANVGNQSDGTRRTVTTGGSTMPKFRANTEKGSRLKYIPKQRMNS